MSKSEIFRECLKNTGFFFDFVGLLVGGAGSIAMGVTLVAVLLDDTDRFGSMDGKLFFFSLSGVMLGANSLPLPNLWKRFQACMSGDSPVIPEKLAKGTERLLPLNAIPFTWGWYYIYWVDPKKLGIRPRK
jgi:hypothetical protein